MNEKVFRDPVHTYIHVNNQVIYDLINTKEFQRLRRIKQTSTTSFTFHFHIVSEFMNWLVKLQKSLMNIILIFGIKMSPC